MEPANNNWKNSSSDLQSRLKTRKLLGVGEASDGSLHRSKISQILGLNEHLFIKLPLGLAWFQLAQWAYLLLYGALCLAAPSLAAKSEFAGAGGEGGLRLLGGAFLGAAGLLSASLRSRDGRAELAAVLSATAAFFGALAASSVWAFLCSGGEGGGSLAWYHVALRGGLAAANLAFHDRVTPTRSFWRAFASFLPSNSAASSLSTGGSSPPITASEASPNFGLGDAKDKSA